MERDGYAAFAIALPRAPGRLADAAGALGRALAGERERWALWAPVGLGTGAGIYFALPSEPPQWLGALLALNAAVLAVSLRQRLGPVLAALAALAVALGFYAAQLRVAGVDAPILAARLGPVAVSGRVVAVERGESDRRITLDHLAVNRLTQARTPARIRLRDRTHGSALTPGDRVRLRAVLLPPPRPTLPGGFDYARLLYFERIGAVGFTVGAPEVTARDRGGGFALWLARLRQTVTARILARLEGPEGAVAAALLSGDRGAIPPEVMAALRDSGLAHLLAISGLHLSLVALTLFFLLRAGLALIEPVALKYPIKKWAAAVALIGAFAYLLLTGATVPTQRAFIMLGIVLLAVLVDRSAISMRLVAWAAAAILLLAPESLLNVSFQMSFAAVIALVAVYESLRGRSPLSRAGVGLPGRILLYVGAVALTTLVASLATAPFAAFHFNRLAVFGLAANLIAVPVTALWIMPLGLLALILMPFGLESLALVPMGWGVSVVIEVSRTVAGWPGANLLVTAMPGWGLAVACFGALWLALWKGRARLAGAPVVLAGLASGIFVPQADILMSESGRLVAVRDDAGRLVLSTTRAERFTGEVWLRAAAQRASPDWPEAGRVVPQLALRCDALGCIYRAKGRTVALAFGPGALAEDCHRAQVVISPEPIRLLCPAAREQIDRWALWRAGAHAVYLRGDGRIRVESVRGVQGDRPWVRKPETTRAPAATRPPFRATIGSPQPRRQPSVSP